MVAKALVCPSNGTVPIRIANPYNESISLNKHTVVATYESIEPEGIVSVIATQLNVTQSNAMPSDAMQSNAMPSDTTQANVTPSNASQSSRCTQNSCTTNEIPDHVKEMYAESA